LFSALFFPIIFNPLILRAASEFQRALEAGKSQELRCPITDGSFTPHAGAVSDVRCSPHHVSLGLVALVELVPYFFFAISMQ
jgi:hypothetical protein